MEIEEFDQLSPAEAVKIGAVNMARMSLESLQAVFQSQPNITQEAIAQYVQAAEDMAAEDEEREPNYRDAWNRYVTTLRDVFFSQTDLADDTN